MKRQRKRKRREMKKDSRKQKEGGCFAFLRQSLLQALAPFFALLMACLGVVLGMHCVLRLRADASALVCVPPSGSCSCSNRCSLHNFEVKRTQEPNQKTSAVLWRWPPRRARRRRGDPCSRPPAASARAMRPIRRPPSELAQDLRGRGRDGCGSSQFPRRRQSGRCRAARRARDGRAKSSATGPARTRARRGATAAPAGRQRPEPPSRRPCSPPRTPPRPARPDLRKQDQQKQSHKYCISTAQHSQSVSQPRHH